MTSFSPSSIICSGASLLCSTDALLKFACHVEFATRPIAPTVCKVENACLQNYTLTLYSDSPYSRAFHDVRITTNPLLNEWNDPAGVVIKLEVVDPSNRNEVDDYKGED